MEREQVVQNQRARLCGAMIEAVAGSGWAATTVAGVLELAGVSRRSFYEQFSNKEECLMATYDTVVTRSRKLVIDAWSAERGWDNRLHAACKALLDDIAAAPKAPRLVLVESLGAGPTVREHMQLAAHAFDRLVAFALSSAPRDARLPRLTCRAIVAGVRHVLFTHLLEGREQQLYTLTEEVLDWCESYRSPLAARLAITSSAAEERPAGPAPVAFLSGEGERARAFSSLIHLTFDDGYASLLDAQIAQFAGISTEVFHRQFASKEQCFLALLDEIAQDARRCARLRMTAAASWPESVRLGIGAFVDYLVEHDALARVAFVELFQAGPAIIPRLTRSVEELLRSLTEAAPEPRRGPLIAEQAVAGALWGIVSSYPLGNRLSRLRGLVDQLSFFVLAPYIGAEAAVEAIEAPRRPPDVG
jgi:AcrR family transcriptional regulator